LLNQVEQELGPPPCPYAWLVLGSEGRLEQTVRTDQDNALVYANEADTEAENYFERLSGRVVDQLIACGFPPCPGDIMATNPQWRQPLHVWQNYFERWIETPNEEALMRAAIFFDYRKVHGALDVEPALRPVIKQGRDNRIFLGRMARNALRQTPPLGLFRNFVLERSGESRDLLDLKARGVALIVDLARLYALEAGSKESNTLARLRTAAGKSSLDREGAEKLTAAFELISLFRIRHQYQQIQRGEEPDNLVPVSDLSKLEQRDLKEAFRAVATSQRGIEFTFQTSMFG
jgi:CBS domain-containing protein